MVRRAIKPDYKGGSIVNLISSIAKTFGAKTAYIQLNNFPKSELQKAKNVVLVVLDGLGYDYVLKNKSNSFLGQNLLSSITTVYPATTISAMTSYYTGQAPGEHGLVGWFSYFKELGYVARGFYLNPRGQEITTADNRRLGSIIYDTKPIFKKLKVKSFAVNIKHDNASYSNHYQSGSTQLHYKTLDDFLSSIKKAISSSNRRKYIFAYWPRFDFLSHKHGKASNQVAKHYKQVDKAIGSLCQSLKNTNSIIIVTADHGHHDVPANHHITRAFHPILDDLLVLPFGGDTRNAYCYIKNGGAVALERYVRNKLKNKVQLIPTSNLIDQKYFGLGKIHKHLKERVGDYVLSPTDGYMIHDQITGEEPSMHIGCHGGMSKQEMQVPLIIIDTNKI